MKPLDTPSLQPTLPVMAEPVELSIEALSPVSGAGDDGSGAVASQATSNASEPPPPLPRACW